MSNKNSKFLLQALVGISLLGSLNLLCIDELGRLKDLCIARISDAGTACINGINYLQPICAEKMHDIVSFCSDSAQSIRPADAIYTGIGVVSSAVGAASGYYGSKALQANDIVAGTAAVAGAMLGASLICGIYNVRAQDAMLQGIENRYGLTPVYDWYQLPGYYATKVVCYGSDVSHDNEFSPFMQTIKSKVGRMSDATIFDFALFIGQFPHTDLNKNYSIAKKYFSDFGCLTLSDLQRTVNSSISMVKQDFKTLMRLTELSNAYKLPVTLNDYNNLPVLLNQAQQHLIINSYLGVFGYSPLQNGQRVKDCMISLAKYHAFLLHLQEILATCSDSSDTVLQGVDGHLNFTLQHINKRVEII